MIPSFDQGIWRRKRLMSITAKLDNEADVIARAQKGDEQAFTQLLTHYYPMLYRVAYKWCANQAEAEDVAQEAAMKIGRTLAGFRGDCAFTSWVYRIVVNLTKDKLRQRKPEVCLSQAHDVPDAAAGLEQQMLLQRLWDQVRSLPEPQGDVMLLVYAEGMTHAEVAQILACAESTVSWYIHEAKKTLSRMNASDE